MLYLYRVLRMALRALSRNVMRSVLTTLGIIIGVGAVIAMVQIGQGSSNAVQRTISSMGANILLVLPGSAASGGQSWGGGSVFTLTAEDGDAIARECPAVKSVAPVVRKNRPQLQYGNRNWIPPQLYGTTEAFLAVREWQNLADGETFSDRDVRNQTKVCLLGQTPAQQLFQDEPPVGKYIRLQNVTFRVVGVLSRKGANMMGSDQDDIIIAPWTTVMHYLSGQTSAQQNSSVQTVTTTTTGLTQYDNAPIALYSQPSGTETQDTPQPVRFPSVDQLLVQADTTADIPAAITQMTELLHERHHIQAGQVDDFNIRDMTEMNNALASTSKLMGALLLCVACISLVVGGVGIMNIMLVSVTERTREIGLRMAVGARGRDIQRQFLIEAVLLCLIGGLVGIVFGMLGSLVVRVILHWEIVVSVPAILAAVLVSATVGVIFGYYPAWKASRLDPIEALRYE